MLCIYYYVLQRQSQIVEDNTPHKKRQKINEFETILHEESTSNSTEANPV